MTYLKQVLSARHLEHVGLPRAETMTQLEPKQPSETTSTLGNPSRLLEVSRRVVAPVGPLARQHPAILAGVLVSMFVVSRLWHVAGFDLVTLSALVDTTAAQTILIGALAPILQNLGRVLAISVMLYIVGRQLGAVGMTDEQRVAAGLLLAGATVLIAMFSPPTRLLPPTWASLGVLAGLVAYVALANHERIVRVVRWVHRRGGRFGRSISALSEQAVALSYLLMGVFVFISVMELATNDTPWIPPERFTMSDGPHIVGYALSQVGGDLIVMTHEDRLLQRVSSTDVDSRMYCVPPRTDSVSSAESQVASDGYPQCEQ